MSHMTPSDDIHLKFREARIKAGMTQSHLADAAHLSIRTVRRADGGENVGHEARRALAAVLGLDLAELPMAAENTSERAMFPQEVILREFSYRIFAIWGGLHPILCLCFFGLILYSFVDPITSMILFPICVVAAYILAWRNDLDHGMALEFVRGRRFIDGTPTDLERRFEDLGYDPF